MPTGTMQSSQKRAAALRETWITRRKYTHTNETDAVVRKAYHFWITYGNRKTIPGAAKKLGWPQYAVTHRARDLGISRTKERPWTAAEEAILEDWSWLSVTRIARRLKDAGFKRGEAAVRKKLDRMQLRNSLDGWYVRELADIMGVPKSKVSTWIKHGMLGAKGTGISTGKYEKVFITSKDVRQFILNYPEEVELTRVDKFWLLGVLCPNDLCRAWRKEAA